MAWNVVTVAFGDKKYKRGQRFLDRHSQKCDANHFGYGESDLLKSDLYKQSPEWMSPENNYGWFAWKPYFILKTMERLQDGDKIFFLDSLDIYHPEIFSYVDDVIYCLEKLAFDKNINKEIINVGPDEESITIKNLANLVANEVGYNGKAIHMPARPQEVKIATCSAEKSRRLLNYSTKTTLKEAIKYTADYIRKMGTRPFKYYLPIEIINDKTPQSWIKKTI